MQFRKVAFLAFLPVLSSCAALDDEETDAIGMVSAEASGPGDGGGDTDPNIPTPGRPVPPAFHKLQFRGMWVIDMDNGLPATSVKVDDIWRWPVWHDLKPNYVHLIWVAPTAQAAANVPAMADESSGWTVELRVNGSKLRRGHDVTDEFWTSHGSGVGAVGCPPNKTCLFTSIRVDAIWFKARPWQLELSYHSGRAGDAPMTVVTGKATTHPTSAQHSYFAGALIPTFRHSNCSTCHSLGSEAVLAAEHGPWSSAVQVVPEATPHGTLLTCEFTCHDVADVVPGETFTQTEWMAPAFDQGLNFSTRTDAQICAKLKQRLPTGDAVLEHFLEDARIAWAVEDGDKPFGIAGPSAWPNSYQDLAANVSAWVASGMPCPPGP